MIDIKVSNQLAASERAEWDAFVNAHLLGTVCHRVGYAEVIRESIGYDAVYFRLYVDGVLSAVWPLSLQKVPFQARLISMPLYETGGPLCLDTVTNETFQPLAEAVKQFAIAHGVSVIESRMGIGLAPPSLGKFFKSQLVWEYASLPLSEPEHMYRKVIDLDLRRSLTKARTSGLVVTERHDADSIREWFYPFYRTYMKQRHGAPPLPLSTFLGFSRELGDCLQIHYVHLDKQLVAALVGYAVAKRIYVSQMPTHPDYLKLRGIYLAYWAVIEWGCANGFTYLDFGNVRYGGQRLFKQKWGCEFSEYRRYYLPLDDKFEPPAALDPSDSKYVLASKIWRGYVPESLTPMLGKWIHQLLGE